ncbi:MAG: DNA polymerase III subunit delta [Patescibacteria group bacterium]|nr:DNA polymerase III subunit delta [Patescibacteria group bacterium]
MFVFLYGENSFNSLKKLREIIECYEKSHKSGLNFKNYDCEKSDFIEIERSVQNVSMFDEKKIIILRNAFSNATIEEQALKFAKKIKKTPDAFVFFEKNKVKKASSLFKFLKRNAKSQEFNFFTDQELKKYIITEFEKYNAKIENSALSALMNFVGADLWQMSQEIQKIINYKTEENKNKEKIITEKDIVLLVEPKIKTDIFKTIDAIGQKNKKLALFLIHKHLKKGDSPFYLFSMINFQFRNLLIVKELAEKYNSIYNFPKISGMHPFVVKKSFFQSQQFTFNDLKSIYKKLFETDLKIKTGKINPIFGLDMLITGL